MMKVFHMLERFLPLMGCLVLEIAGGMAAKENITVGSTIRFEDVR